MNRPSEEESGDFSHGVRSLLKHTHIISATKISADKLVKRTDFSAADRRSSRIGDDKTC